MRGPFPRDQSLRVTPEEQLQTLTVGAAKVLSEKELLEKLRLGRPLRINLLRHLRGEIAFSGPDALAGQIRRDIEVARKVLAKEHRRRLIAYHRPIGA